MPRHLNAVRAKTRTVRCGGLSAHRRNTGWARGREDEEGVYKEDMMSSGQYPFTSSYKMMDELYSRRPNSRGGSLTMLPQASFHATLPSVWLSTNWREPPRVSSLAPRLVCPRTHGLGQDFGCGFGLLRWPLSLTRGTNSCWRFSAAALILTILAFWTDVSTP